MDVVKKFFRPEFINRLDSMVIFNSLDEKMITTIVDIQLKEVAKRLERQGLHLEVTDGVKRHLKTVGFDEIFGARPLKRVINDLIIDEIALQIVEGKIKTADTVVVDYKQGKIQVSIKKAN